MSSIAKLFSTNAINIWSILIVFYIRRKRKIISIYQTLNFQFFPSLDYILFFLKEYSYFLFRIITILSFNYILFDITFISNIF
jgi:hypothetical protein